MCGASGARGTCIERTGGVAAVESFGHRGIEKSLKTMVLDAFWCISRDAGTGEANGRRDSVCHAQIDNMRGSTEVSGSCYRDLFII